MQAHPGLIVIADTDDAVLRFVSATRGASNRGPLFVNQGRERCQNRRQTAFRRWLSAERELSDDHKDLICKNRCCSTLIALGLLTSTLAAAPATKTAAFPLTTKSPEARRLLDEALVQYIDHVAQPKRLLAFARRLQPIRISPWLTNCWPD